MIVNLVTRSHPINWWMCRRFRVYGLCTRFESWITRQLYLLRNSIGNIEVAPSQMVRRNIGAGKTTEICMQFVAEKLSLLPISKSNKWFILHGLVCLCVCVFANASSKSDTNQRFINGLFVLRIEFINNEMSNVFKTYDSWECVWLFIFKLIFALVFVLWSLFERERRSNRN